MMEPHLKESEVDGDHDKEGNNDGLQKHQIISGLCFVFVHVIAYENGNDGFDILEIFEEVFLCYEQDDHVDSVENYQQYQSWD